MNATELACLGFPEAGIAIYFATKPGIARERSWPAESVQRGRNLPRGTGSEHGVEENAEKMADILFRDHGWIDEVLKRQRTGKRAESRGGRGAGNRERPAGDAGDAAKQDRRQCAEPALARAKARVSFGMADGEELELERKQRQAAVLRDLERNARAGPARALRGFPSARAANSLRRCVGRPSARAARRKCLPCSGNWRRTRRACSRPARQCPPGARPRIHRVRRLFPRRAKLAPVASVRVLLARRALRGRREACLRSGAGVR